MLKHIKDHYFRGLSLRRDPNFVRSMVIVIGVVLVWRGLWNLMDMYLLPDDPIMSNIIGTVIGIFLLFLVDGDLENLAHIRGNKSKSHQNHKEHTQGIDE